MTAPTLADLQTVARWRETCPESLRTPHPLSEHDQRRYLERIESSRHQMRMWSFREQPKPGAIHYVNEMRLVGLAAFGGLQYIQWENSLAEISLIVDPDQHGKGVGERVLLQILEEAFGNLGLNQVWGECYACSPALGFWETRANWSTVLPERKRWNGKLHDSLYFCFRRPFSDRIRATSSSRK